MILMNEYFYLRFEAAGCPYPNAKEYLNVVRERSSPLPATLTTLSYVTYLMSPAFTA